MKAVNEMPTHSYSFCRKAGTTWRVDLDICAGGKDLAALATVISLAIVAVSEQERLSSPLTAVKQ